MYEIVDNAIDEALAGFCDHTEVIIREGNIIRVMDNGSRHPVDIQPKLGIPAVTVVFTILHARAANLAVTILVQGRRRSARRGRQRR